MNVEINHKVLKGHKVMNLCKEKNGKTIAIFVVFVFYYCSFICLDLIVF
jgi:hypothetical protein